MIISVALSITNNKPITHFKIYINEHNRNIATTATIKVAGDDIVLSRPTGLAYPSTVGSP
jgi:hypothetical protein